MSSQPRHTAFDEAMNLIQQDKKERLEMLTRVEKEIDRVTKGTLAAQLTALSALKTDLLVKSELNDPAVRQNFENNKVDMSKPVYRYLSQRQFNNFLRPKLLERVTQMSVVPDLVDVGVQPQVQINVQLPNQSFEPGDIVTPDLTTSLPTINITNYHTDSRLYTILLVDPDSPDVTNKTYQQYCHWMITNVELSATESQVQGGQTVLAYQPPHPQKGTKKHRYTWIAYEQPTKIDVTPMSRDGFNTKAFAQQHSLVTRGVNFVRQQWDASVSDIYKDILGIQEPIYGKPPKVEHYIQRHVYI
ncbi:PEBP-like protein [Hesseltinella vesiculosa]|uniref:PEBP-like protein n=1 Tax=Hesseltinella vesiculosa TaxID=101127 RepID=A0A1X2GUM8_9FUNG|nr:PEBP-like protein [Hesseltinella vesiculosa]